MNETPRPSLPSSIALAAVLAVGGLSVWSAVANWEFAIESQLFSVAEPNESLVFTEVGEPLIQSSTYQPSHVTVYRTLDGQQIDDLGKFKLQWGGSWLPAARMPYFDETSWYTRITGFVEPGGMPHYWYLLTDSQTPQHGYFIGFDARTKNLIGYVGLEGFRTDPPPKSAQFELELQGSWGRFAGQYGMQGREPSNLQDLRPALFLVSGHSLVRVDLRRRVVNKLPLDGKFLSVGDVGQPIHVPDEPEAINKQRIAARQGDRILVLDDAGQVLRSINLPEETRGRMLIVYLTAGTEAIVEAMADLKHELTEVFWLTPEGSVTRHEQVRLRGSPFRFTGEQPAWKTAVDFPSPLLCAAAFAVWVPRSQVKIGMFDDFRTALDASLVKSWPTFLVVLAGSAVLAVLCFRRQRRYSRRGALAWAIFVLLAGPAGLLGYLLHRQWPATQRCVACGTTTPRDRESCLECSAEFPRPTEKGIEIFA